MYTMHPVDFNNNNFFEGLTMNHPILSWAISVILGSATFINLSWLGLEPSLKVLLMIIQILSGMAGTLISIITFYYMVLKPKIKGEKPQDNNNTKI